ncbi:MAG: SulP family inorganic anion transporter [Acidimicrobiales bacterium]
MASPRRQAILWWLSSVTGGFSRTVVNDNVCARTPLASLVIAAVILLAILFLTPPLPNPAECPLGAIIIVAVIGLFDIKEMRHIAAVKRSDLVGLGVAFFATLVLGIERGSSSPSSLRCWSSLPGCPAPCRHAGPGSRTTTFRNVQRFRRSRPLRACTCFQSTLRCRS